ncbi:hypothetical protein MCOR27_006909 [Pyricularia oryzae]|uniref:Guanine nucleotide-binding protein subunit gamma n=4 Tax=Pyricularia TaxID=48558 RepID=A0ABQ8NW14_PYRGI|nr:hypothetical protein MCOR01_010893 [Pyricularia oryzae]KAI6301993.1 hypothetical protein MCOR33_002615 [Pyricularia grisea]KAI6251815.1 Guanine nucleotide-binding protein subunit gamma, variant 2 [Pyricularia oryzae]KAI6268581.1 hypothetical protein MCOR26_009127 [Pyricularia oryzae]KAI6273241.1 hypothetical protein MCOR34_011574 [Pyricularia oryzae]
MLHHHTSADKARYSTACGTNLDDTADQTTMDSSQDTRQQKQEQQPHKPTSQQPRADKSKSKSSNNSGSSQQLQSPTKSHSSSQADSSRHIISAKPSTSTEMPQYTSRDMGDPSQIRRNKQSMADLKLRRLTELNSRLKEDLERERIPVSQASKSIIAYCNSTRDYMVPSVWGAVPKGEDPYAPQQNGGCCLVM